MTARVYGNIRHAISTDTNRAGTIARCICRWESDRTTAKAAGLAGEEHLDDADSWDDEKAARARSWAS